MKTDRLHLLLLLAAVMLSQHNLSAQVTMDKFMGVNIHRTDPISQMTCAGIVREYHFWEADEKAGTAYGYNQYEWNPAAQGKALILSFDDFYDALAAAGLEILVTTRSSIPQLYSSVNCSDDIPVPGSASTTDPSSYLWHADYLTQFASRYGSSSGNTILSSSHLKLASNQVDNYHHDVIKYIENWNEPDRWWNLTNCPNWHFDADEYAAMTMADWNGDGGTMSGYKYVPDPNNPGQFIQQNYPSNSLGLSGKGLTFVSAGISEFDIPYMQDIVSEFGGNPPFGVINFHHYSDNLPDDINSPNYNIGQVGICPEEDNLRSNLEDVKAEFSSLGVEIWLTEFGYDSNSDSWRRAPEINGEDGDYDSQEVQGQWVIRSFLEAAASGIDRAFVFTLSDPNSDGVGGDEGSGLLKDKSYNYQRKKAWYYVNTM